jgi:formylglycine-generating enzyme required for sulfatase activity
LLLEWLDGYIHAQTEGRVPPSFASTAIRAGGCFILLDGLDETGDARERDYMQRLIVNLAQACPDNRYLVASRPYDGLSLTGFADYHLSPLNRDEVKLLLENWFGAIRRQNTSRRATGGAPAANEVAYLLGILDDSPRLFEMATNPLLLTTMALLVHGGTTLPRERAELYNRLVPLLIRQWRETQMSGGKPPGQQAEAQLYETESDSSVQRRLQELAAWMQEQQRREIRLAEAQDVLRPIYRDLMRHQGWNDEQCDDRVARLLGSLELHSGLIQGRDRGYSFAHYTIQEYLTARAYDRRTDGVAQLLAHAEQPRWHETILLAVGHWATQGPTERAQELLGALLDAGTLPALQLAATALDDADAGRVPELAELRSRTIDGLRANAFHPTTCPDPVQRARCAELLDRLGADTDRPGLDLTQDTYWAARIEPGTFSMGDDGNKFDYTIQHPYALARYPVTNRQYLLFVEALDGRGTPEAVAAAQQLLAVLEQRELTLEQIRPRFWPGGRYRAGEGNHPVIGVTWYAATAFAWWADAWLHAAGVLTEAEAVRLPTEPEWERAAAYPLTVSGGATRTKRREFPWGDWPELTETTATGISGGIPANTEESQIYDTSPVGIFLHGAAACGAEELAGNVWEWCATAYQNYPLPNGWPTETLDTVSSERIYVLRGGSWNVHRGLARCAYRGGLNPDHVTGSSGFRLARLFSLSSS